MSTETGAIQGLQALGDRQCVFEGAAVGHHGNTEAVDLIGVAGAGLEDQFHGEDRPLDADEALIAEFTLSLALQPAVSATCRRSRPCRSRAG